MNFLQSIPEFAALRNSELSSLEAKGTTAEYPKGAILFQAGDAAEHVWFVKTGRVTMGYYSSRGSFSANCIATERDIFCCLPTLDRQPYPVTAVSAVPSTVFKLPLATFHKAMRKHPKAYNKIVTRFCGTLRNIECKFCHRVDTAEERIAAALVELEKKYGSRIPVTRSEIAELTGTTIETAIRVISRFRKEGVIGSEKRLILITHLGKLQNKAVPESNSVPV